jgi:zinc protease
MGALSQASDPLDVDARVVKLENGLTVVLEEQHRTDVVALHLHYDVGSRDELTGEKGCAHLFEHLMFEGSSHVEGNAFDEWLTAAGGSNNAWTSEDETAYHMTFPSGALDLALFLESDRLGYLLDAVDQEDVTNQQGVVLQERSQGYDAPHGRDYDALSRLQHPPTHPYHVPVIGQVADIEGFEADAVKAFFRKHYHPATAVMGLVGNFDTDEVIERLEYWFADVVPPEPPVARLEGPADVAWPRVDGKLEDRVEDYKLYLSWPTPPMGHDDEAALLILSYILSDGRGTRLDDALYYRGKLATADGAMSWASELSGQFIVHVSSDQPKLPKLAKKAGKIVQKVARKPPTEAELTRAVKSVRSSLLDMLEDPGSRAEALVDCQRRFGKPDCLHDEWARIEAVTSEDVVRVVSTWLTPERLVTLSVVPMGKDGALEGAEPVELP